MSRPPLGVCKQNLKRDMCKKTKTKKQLRRTLGFLEFYLEHLSRARALVQESHRTLALYNHAVPKGLGDALATDMLQEQVAWIQEELT